jgi:hypothetical protein
VIGGGLGQMLPDATFGLAFEVLIGCLAAEPALQFRDIDLPPIT